MRRKVLWATNAVAIIVLIGAGVYFTVRPRAAHANVQAVTANGVTIENTLGGQYSNPTAINDAGIVVGSADTGSGSSSGFYWQNDGTGMHPLAQGSPTGINNSNQIVGNGPAGPVEWMSPSQDPPMPLPLPANTSGGVAQAINDQGQVIGTVTDDTTGMSELVTWVNGVPQPPLQNPTGVPGLTGCGADDINNQGEIVGNCSQGDGPYSQGYYWQNANTLPVALGSLNGGSGAEVFSVNDQGHMVGISGVTSFQSHATMWQTPSLAPIDLGVAVSPTTTCSDCSIANAVNNEDQTVGYAYPLGGTLFEDGDLIQLQTQTSYCQGGTWGQAINNMGDAIGVSFCGLGVFWHITGSPPTPQERIEAMSAQVQDLVAAGTLNAGQGNALQASLNAALASLGKGNSHATCNQLQAFVNKVQADMASGRLTAAQGQPLIDAATPLITKYCS